MVEIGLRLRGSFSLSHLHTIIIRLWINFCDSDIKQIMLSDNVIIIVFFAFDSEVDDLLAILDRDFKSLECVSSMEVGLNV